MQVPFYNSLRFKIGFSYIVLILINVGVTIWTIYNFGRLSSALSDILTNSFPTVIAVENMARSVERHDKAVRAFLNGDFNNGKIELTLAKEDFFRSFDQTQDEISNDLNKAILEDIKSTHAGYLLLIDSLQHIVEKGRFDAARLFHYDALVPFYQRLSDNCYWLIEENQKTMTQVSARAKEITNDAVIAILSASLLALVFSIIIISQFTKLIILPAEKLTATVNKIGRGQLDLKIDVLTADEFGLLSREFNKMTERLRRFEAMNIDKILLEKQKSDTIVNSMADAIIVCDVEGKIQHMNEVSEKLFALKRESMMDRFASELTSDAMLGSIFKEKEQSEYVNKPFLEFSNYERTVYLRPRISPIYTRYKEREGTVFILQDVTQFKELDKMKSDFMATVSHEFRTPVTSMTLGVDILRQQMLGPLTKAQEDMLESFKQDCGRLTKLVRDLLQLSTLESGKNKRKEEPVEISTLIKSTVSQLHLLFKEKGITLELNIPEKMPVLTADEQQISWIFVNLLNNALQFTNSGGRVEVCGSYDEDWIYVQVKDSGKGIPKDSIGKIFNKFVQLKNPNDPTPGRVGLGLSIAKDIVELYGGEINVESELNKGSTFVVQLPIRQGEKV